ncbi:MAG: hypothetical protein U0223_15925 [Nitrospira sp.]|nr:hypothetical protein [Nitrospira sp.]
MYMPRMMQRLRMSMLSNQWYLNVLCLLAIGLSPSLSCANETKGPAVEQIGLNGSYNWTTDTATATGVGIPPQNITNAFQAREMTRTAAWSVALANLLEVVNGIRVDAQTTIKNHVTSNAEVQTHIEGMVKRASVIEEKELPTGEFRITVQMHVPPGILPPNVNPGPPTVVVSEPKRIPGGPPPMEEQKIKKGNSPPKTKTPPEPPTTYTGVLVDARGTKMKPAMKPRIGTKDKADSVYCEFHVGETIISGPTVPKEDQRKIAWYEFDEAKARSHARAGKNPLIIKAAQASGANNSDLIIDETLAQKLALSPVAQDLLYNAKVVILTDPLTAL